MVAADAAIEFIRAQSANATPFLAVVWFGSPHAPHKAAAEDRQLYADQGKQADWLGEISGIDRAVGKMRAALRDLKIHENTLFWYTSDNGGLKTESSGGRGKKGSIYQGGLRVPAIIEWPARIKQPRITQIPSSTSDIYPTLLDLVGITPENQPPLDGISLVPTIDGEGDARRSPLGFWDYTASGISTPTAVWMKELLEAQKAGKDYHDEKRLFLDAGEITKTYPRDKFPGHAAWLEWPWKLHHLSNRKAGGEIRIELYHLGDDPMETNDLSAKHPERVTAMRAALETWLGSVVDSLNGADYTKLSSELKPAS